jgi:hypothetical protein
MSKLSAAAGDTLTFFSIMAGFVGAACAIATLVAIPITLFYAWLTHVIICIQAHDLVFLIIGALFFPIGMVHGAGHWFGAW